jgi:hypothetical protein
MALRACNSFRIRHRFDELPCGRRRPTYVGELGVNVTASGELSFSAWTKHGRSKRGPNLLSIASLRPAPAYPSCLLNRGAQHMSLLDSAAPHVVIVFVEETVTDTHGNTIKRPSATGVEDRGRDRPCGRPPAQIPACAANALGSCLGFWRRSVSPGMDASRGRVVATGSRYRSSAPS